MGPWPYYYARELSSIFPTGLFAERSTNREQIEGLQTNANQGLSI